MAASGSASTAVAVESIATWAQETGSVCAASSRVALWKGDMTLLAADAVVNAANTGLRRGGGICGAIHRVAGTNLERECRGIGSCATGGAVMTKGYNLPAKHVVHAVGPVGENAAALQSAYKSSLDVAHAAHLSSIGLCCISTGVYGYPPAKAAPVALAAVREWLDGHADAVLKIVFVVFSASDRELYESEMAKVFV